MYAMLPLVLMLFTREVLIISANNCAIREKVMDCSGKHLNKIPHTLNQEITTLDLSYNNLIDIKPFAFSNLTYLIALDLHKCNIHHIDSKGFKGLINLQKLRLDDNAITLLSDNIFSDLHALKELNINHCGIEVVPSTALFLLENLEVLSMTFLNGNMFDKKLYSLKSLKEININHGMWETFVIKNETFLGLSKSPIKTLRLSAPILYIEVNAFQHFHDLELFFLNVRKKGYLENIFKALYGLRNKRVEILHIENTDDRFKGNTLNADAAKYLMTINITSLIIRNANLINIEPIFIKMMIGVELHFIDFSQNMLYPESFNAIALWKKLEMAIVSNVYPIYHKRSFFKNELVAEIFFPPRLWYVDISFSRWKMPSTSFKLNALNLKFLDMSNSINMFCSKLYSISLPKSLEVLNISNIYCRYPKTDMFDLPNLKILVARRIRIDNIAQLKLHQLFKRLCKLEIIDLSENNISMQTPFLNQASQSIKSINFSKMYLKSFPLNIVNKLPFLHFLNLTNNNIMLIDRKSIQFLKKQKQVKIDLKGNVLSCTCSKTTLEFLSSIRFVEKNIYNFKDMTCRAENGSLVKLANILNDLTSYKISCMSPYVLKLSIIIVALFLLFMAAVIFAYRHRFFLHYTYKRMHHRVSGYSTLKSYKFDLFICFNSNDSSWVRKELYDKIKEELDLNICVYDKDFPVATSISDCILEAIDQSEKILFVVTENFLKSEWCKYEMQMVKVHLTKCGKSNQQIILLMKDNIYESEMPKEMKWMWNKFVGLSWNEVSTGNILEKLFKVLSKKRHDNLELTGVSKT